MANEEKIQKKIEKLNSKIRDLTSKIDLIGELEGDDSIMIKNFNLSKEIEKAQNAIDRHERTLAVRSEMKRLKESGVYTRCQ